jgi:hypothetical protein
MKKQNNQAVSLPRPSSQSLYEGANMNSNINLTDKEKLAKIKEIIENNLHPIFTSFALDLDIYANGNKLEKYVELKELLNITNGSINKQEEL